MVHGLLDVGDEHVSDQRHVHRQGHLVVHDGGALDFGAGGVVLGSGVTNHRELGAAAVADGPLRDSGQHFVLRIELSQDFTSELSEEQLEVIAGALALTGIGGERCHVVFPCIDIGNVSFARANRRSKAPPGAGPKGASGGGGV